MANEEIRKRLKNVGMKLWELADEMGVSEPTVIRWFRHELPTDKREKVEHIIAQAEKERR